jgi:hypothetical protein
VRSRRLLAALAGLAAAAALGSSVATNADAAGGIASQMTCIAPTDAAGIDAMLARAGSPLAGEGATFVAEAGAAGIDPRALVAIAAHETMLETYGPSQAIHNPFGLGPGWAFASDADAIARAAQTLGAYYLPAGRTTIPTIGARWAPLGAANDPAGLNGSWTTGVGTYYAALGGDPARPVLAAAQDAVPACAGGPTRAAASAGGAGPPVVTAWGGAVPRTTSAGPEGGSDPATGEPARIAGFVFPLALAQGAGAAYRDEFADPGPTPCAGGRRRCALTIGGAPDDPVVAMAAGTLHRAGAAARESGVAFWVETPGGDLLGYGPLASYAPGIADGAAVTAGQRLGASPGALQVAWERDGVRIDPYPLLEATRPPS